MKLSVFLVFSTVLICSLSLTAPARASGMFSDCAVIAQAKKELPMLTLVATCTGTSTDRMYGAIAAISNGDGNKAQSWMGVMNVENSCGKAAASQNTCEGMYNVGAGAGGSAYGAGQIVKGTWMSLSKSSALQSSSNLGSCGSSNVSGTLLDPKRTKDGYVLGQFIAFKEAICGRAQPAPATEAGFAYWGKQVGPSLLMSQIHQSSAVVNDNNAAAIERLNSKLDSDAVLMYANHNLGAGGAQKLMTAVKTNPNTSALTILQQAGFKNPAAVAKANSALYCADRNCNSYLSAQQIVERMNNKMYGNSACLNNGKAALARLGAAQPTEAVGPVPTTAGDVPLIPGVTVTPGGYDAIMAAGGAAGEVNMDALKEFDGVSTFAYPAGVDPLSGVEAGTFTAPKKSSAKTGPKDFDGVSTYPAEK